jgi:hypothetical protein
VDRIKVEIEKLREQLGQYEELRSMQECAYREREGSLLRSLKKFIFRYQDPVEIYSVSAEKIINDGFSYSENV